MSSSKLQTEQIENLQKTTTLLNQRISSITKRYEVIEKNSTNIHLIREIEQENLILKEIQKHLGNVAKELEETKMEVEHQKYEKLFILGTLSARVSHDLRNPLSVIKNTIEIMRLKSQNGEKINEYFDRVDRSIWRITHQIDEVLDYVKPRPLNLAKNSILDTIKLSLRRIPISSDIKINLPLNDVISVYDAEKMEIVFVNLITNAIQAMNTKGQIFIKISENIDDIIVEIEDTGQGIPPDVLSKIFEPLFTTKQVGTGLGLVSCKNIVEEHKGRIIAKSKVDKGTTFIIKLPKNPV